MPDDEFKRCEKTLKELKKPKHLEDAWIFLKPVDAGAWGAVDYYEIIKTPMDLSTMEKKLLEYEYANEQEFVNDMHLMFQNCYTYNPPGHPVHQSGKNLEATFEAYWEKLHEKKEKKKSSASKSSKGLKRDNGKYGMVSVVIATHIHNHHHSFNRQYTISTQTST